MSSSPPFPPTLLDTVVGDASSVLAAECPTGWKLLVKVTSEDLSVWPSENVSVTVATKSGTYTGPASAATRLLAQSSPEVEFKGNQDCQLEVQATLPASWTLVAKEVVTLAVAKPETIVRVELKIECQPKVYLRLVYKDPADSEQIFPKDFPVTILYDDDSTLDKTVGDDGKLEFDADKSKAGFTLKFDSAAALYFARSYATPLDATPDRLAADADLNNLHSNKFHFFALPLKWRLSTSDWALAPADPAWQSADHKFKLPGSPDIGAQAAPVKMTLDPHWQFVRFTFFDRRYGESHHTKRISTPALRLKGFRTDPNAATPDTLSNWTWGADPKDALQCLPWINQRQEDGTGLPALDNTMGLQFDTTAGKRTLVYSQSDSVREIQDKDASDAVLKPGPDRLKYYDLPDVWKSRRYYTSFTAASPPGAAGKFFHQLTTGDIKTAEDKTKPLTFCLDDMVLYQVTPGGSPPGAIEPLPALGTLTSPPGTPERVAIFYHRFDDTHADTNPQGVYKSIGHVAAGSPLQVPASEVVVTDNYLSDYPDWTRLVIAQGNLFDAYDARTPDDADVTRVVGARAAVRWLDAMGPFPGINMFAWNDALSPPGWDFQADGLAKPKRLLDPTRPGRTDMPASDPSFSLQPFFEQKTSVRYRQTFNPANDESVGRFDLALLRCCDVDADGDEVAINLHYLKSYFNFNYVPPVSPPGAPLAMAVSQARYAMEISTNVANRWGGNEPGVSTDRAELLPRVTSPPQPMPQLKVKVVWFTQSIEEDRAHYSVDIEPIERDNRGGSTGVGKSGPSSYVEDPAMNHWFPAAHESGHMDGLPDEYNERWWGASYGQLSFKSNLPGDPYEPDGRTEAGDLALSPMMNGNRNMRNRYFWHAAEWVRTIIGTKLKVKYGATYDDYWLPEHPQTAAGRTYYPWPVAHQLGHANNGRTFDLFLFKVGKERWTITDLPNASPADPVDGVLVIAPKLRCNSFTGVPTPDLPTEKSNNSRVLRRLAAAPRAMLSNHWYASGTVNVGSPPETHTFRKCLLQFLPRFAVPNAVHDAEVQAQWAAVSAVFAHDTRVDVRFGPGSPPGTAVSAWPAANHLQIEIATAWAEVDAQFAREFPKTLGINKLPGAIVPADLEPIVRAVMPGANLVWLP